MLVAKGSSNLFHYQKRVKIGTSYDCAHQDLAAESEMTSLVSHPKPIDNIISEDGSIELALIGSWLSWPLREWCFPKLLRPEFD